jgi:uncharacterized membrane protein YhaH (DUF805 family)
MSFLILSLIQMNKFRNDNAKQFNTNGIDVLELYILMWKRYFDFEGTSTRREFWWTQLVGILIALTYQVMIESINDPTLLGAIVIGYGVFVIASIIPGTALLVRRFHDTGVSGWNYLWSFTGIGVVYVFYLLSRESR